MFVKIANVLCKVGDFVEENVNSAIDFFDKKIYNFNHRKELAKKAAIKAKVKELADKFGLPVSNEYNLAITKDTNAQWLINLCCTNEAGYFISCPSDYVVSKCSFTNYKYGVVVVDWKHFYELDDSIDKHIQKLIGRYKECLNEARKKQIEFDFSENKEPLFKELCEHYNLQSMNLMGTDNLSYRSFLVPGLDLYYSPETNKILINPMFIEKEPDMTCGVYAVELNYKTFEEYRDFIDSKIEEFKNNFNININKLLNKKGKNKNDN